MNNEEYLNTLSLEERQNTKIKKFDLIIDSRSYSRYNHIDVNGMFYEYVAWLNSPHETTSDEDFAKINLIPYDNSKTEYAYIDKNTGFMVYVHKDETSFGSIPYGESLSLSEANAIDRIADKKRKEAGWLVL